jgi:hypothetical protein
LGGSTDLQKGSGYYAGDLSGITQKKLHFGFNHFISSKKLPNKKIGIKTRRNCKQSPTMGHWFYCWCTSLDTNVNGNGD